MKITFYSNFLNHHQLPFCIEMEKKIGENFKFVATEKIPKERIELGYEDLNNKYSFVIEEYKDPKRAEELAEESDIIIIGSAPNKYIKIANKKICFRYSERLYKDKNIIKNIGRYLKNFNKSFCERNVYLLCASAFAAKDYSISGAYINKCFKWGYFPEVIKYKDINSIIENKDINSILWVGRFIKWKHPEIVIEIAKELKKQNKDFRIKMIGTGKEKEKIRKMIIKYNLNEEVSLYDSMSPSEIRKNMEKSSIYLFTSDRGEGWGAVLNEAMNSGCAVFAYKEIGSVPFLIKNDINGVIYNSKKDLITKLITYMDNNNCLKKLSVNAYNTMLNEWNPLIATERFLKICSELKKGKNIKDVYEEGPLSKSKYYKKEE